MLLDHMEISQSVEHPVLGSLELDAAAIVAFQTAKSPYAPDFISDKDASRDLNYLTQKGLACTALKEWLNHRTLLPYMVIEDSFARKREDAVNELKENTSQTDEFAEAWSFINKEQTEDPKQPPVTAEALSENKEENKLAHNGIKAFALIQIGKLSQKLKKRSKTPKDAEIAEAEQNEQTRHEKIKNTSKKIGKVVLFGALATVMVGATIKGVDTLISNKTKVEIINTPTQTTIEKSTATTLPTQSSNPGLPPAEPAKPSPPIVDGQQSPDQPSSPIDNSSSVNKHNDWTWEVASRVNPENPNLALQLGMSDYSRKTGQPTSLVPRNGTMWIMVGVPGRGGHIITPQEMEYLNSLIED